MALKRCPAIKQAACRILLMALLCGVLPPAADAAETAPAKGPATGVYQTPEQAFTEAMRHSVGAPAQAELGDRAVVRLDEDLIVVPRDQAVRLLTIWGITVPPDFVALLLGPKGMNAPGIIRYVPAGFTDLSQAAQWTLDDVMSSLADTVENRNAARTEQHLAEQEIRGWVRPPRIDAINRHVSWAALILPKTAAEGTDGETTFNAAGFGRHGHIMLSMLSSIQDAAETGRILDTFLNGLSFRSGEAYADVQPGDPRSPGGLANVLGVDVLHKARSGGIFWMSDVMLQATGGLVALIGALSLLVYVRRYRHRESRRW